MHAIVCEDPNRLHAIGTVIEGPNEIATLKRKKVALLPFDAELPRLAVTGYVQQHFGKGWLLNANSGERACPMMLHITNSCRFLYWAARVERFDNDLPSNLKLRLVHSSDNQRGLGRGMNQLTYVAETPRFENNEAVVYGKAGFDVSQDGLLFTDLYAIASNVVVKWVAITQHWREFQWSEVG